MLRSILGVYEQMMRLLFPKFSKKHSSLFRLLISVGPALTLVLLAVFLPEPVRTIINTVAWVLGNVLLGYSAVVLVVFLGAYFYFFDPRATTGGRLIFQFMLSLVGIISLNVIAVFIDPSRDNAWYIYPDDVDPWRPTVRLIVYGFVAYAVTSLVILLILRKWFPNRVKKASDIELKVRTSENPTIEVPQPPVEEEPKPVITRPPAAETDLIEETWPNVRGPNKK